MQPFAPQTLPIESIDWSRLVTSMGRANRVVASFEGLLYGLPSAEVLLSPMTTQEAVLSSRIEGTQAGLEDVLKFEAGVEVVEDGRRHDIQEIINYRRALRRAQVLLASKPFCLNTLFELHSILLDSVRGYDKGRGQFRRVQNWIGRPNTTIEDAFFVPPPPGELKEHMTAWEAYYHYEDLDPLVQLAVLHAQFELLHPFVDGNGRLGRMLVPLFLFEKGLLSKPCFYLSDYLETHRDTYYARLRALGTPEAWTSWIDFFLTAVAVQGEESVLRARSILDLNERLKREVIELTHSQHAVPLLDLIFQHPIFSSTQFAGEANMPTQQAINQLLGKLKTAEILQTLRPSQGRRAQILIQPDLINLCEGRRMIRQ